MGVLKFDESIRMYPFRPVFGWERKSSDSQAGPKREKLKESAAALTEQLKAAVGGRFVETFCAVEKGKLSLPRKNYRKAVSGAAGGILVAWSLSRHARPNEFDYRTNLHATLTDAEMNQLMEITEGVVLATILPPSATESERRSEAIRRHGNAGPQAKVDHDLAWRVFGFLGQKKPNGRYQRSLRAVEARCGCSKTTILRILQMRVPAALPVNEGTRWRDLPCPAEIFQQMYIPGGPNLQ